MLKKNISWINLDGVEQSEDFYFHLEESDIAEMELSEKDGLEKKLRRIVESQDGGEILQAFKDLILRTVGRREGQRFVRSAEITADFAQTGAYSKLFMELATNADAAALFINSVVPKSLTDKVAADVKADKNPLEMSQEEFDKTYGTDPTKWAPEVMMAAYRRKAAA